MGKFEPGKSGNPGGRPKATEEWKQLLEARTPAALGRLFELTESSKEAIALRAIEVVLTYSLPKPKQEQSIELTGQVQTAGIDASRRETREEWLARRAKHVATTNGSNGSAHHE